MGDPHNPNRAGEEWNQARIDYQLKEIDRIKSIVTLSGGWAWHFMSPPHKEIKTFHDHKDIDVFVKPADFNDLRELFMINGYDRAKTQWDDPSGDFYRYTKYYLSLVSDTGFINENAKVGQVNKVVFDVFLKDVDFIEIKDIKVVEPKYLLTLYGVKHSSEECVAVQAARKLLSKNISPIGRTELINEKSKKRRKV